MSPSTDHAFETLLEFLRDNRGFDFTGYKRASLMRRVRARMLTLGIDDFSTYQEHLELHQDEFVALFNTILINVTEFFRDPSAWETLSRDHLPRVLAQAGEDRGIRVWSAGCATGQETYTLAMVLAEAMGIERFERQVKVYATDVDEEALGRGRLAQYTEREMESVPPALRERYFVPLRDQWVFRNDLRRLVIFGRHDLTRDAPISHLDLLVCRNVLMYFNAEAQHRILTRFHFAMEEEAILFLGRAEMLRSHGSLFAPVDLKARIFTKEPRADMRERLLMLARTDTAGMDGRTRVSQQLRLRSAALDAVPVATVAVDTLGTLVMANQPARALFGLTAADVGRPLQDLTLSYRPVELRSRIDGVNAERRPVHVSNVEWASADGVLRHLDVEVFPLLEDGGALIGVGISFADVTRYHRLRAELVDAIQELETAFEELQSTNEELETINEELQATNEELETTNDELASRTGELNQANAYIGSILASLRMGVVVLDRERDIRVWSERAEELWGLRAREVIGHPFQNLDIGLPVERLKAPIRACIEGGEEYQEVVLDAVNRRGRAIRCRVACTPLLGDDTRVLGAVLLMEEWSDGAKGDGSRAARG